MFLFIFKNDPDRIIFFENSLGLSGFLPNGFSAGPGGKESNNKQAFSYHIYCAQQDVRKRNMNELKSNMNKH